MGNSLSSLMGGAGLANSGTLGTNSKIGLGLDLWSAYSNYMGSRRQAEAQADQIIQQGKNMIKTMNYAFSNFENERRNSFEASVAQLGAIRLQARGLEASVQNATGELQSGKTAKLLVRSTQADGLRTTTQVKDNYIRKSDEIDQNKERQFLSTQQYLSQLQTPRIPTLLGGIIGQAGNLLSSYNAYRNMNANRISKIGIDGQGVGGTSGQGVPATTSRWTPNNSFRTLNDNPWRTSTGNGFSLNGYTNGVLGHTVSDPKAVNYGNPVIRFDTDSSSYVYQGLQPITSPVVGHDYRRAQNALSNMNNQFVINGGFNG